MLLFKHPNCEKIKIGSVNVSSGHLTFFDPFLHQHFPNRLDQILDKGSFETFLYKFKDPVKSNGIIATQVVFKNTEPVNWQDAEYLNDPKSDFLYTNSCGLIADTCIFDDQTIESLKMHIDNVIGTGTRETIGFYQFKPGKDINCVYFECGNGWYDQTADLKWGFDKDGKLCCLLVDFYSHLL